MQSLFTLLHEWLARYYDGASHTLYAGTAAPVAVTFPDARYSVAGQPQSSIVFETMPPAQPLADQAGGWEIRIVPQSRLEKNREVEGGKLVSVVMSLHFWVTAKKPQAADSLTLGRSVADALHALLGDPAARYDLAEKGITHLQPSAPVPALSVDGDKRLLTCTADCQYIIPV